VHLKLVKLSWTGPSQMAIKGHCVCVPHDGADATENTLPRNIDDVLCVKYFGPPEHMQAMKSRFKSFPQTNSAEENVEQYLQNVSKNLVSNREENVIEIHEEKRILIYSEKTNIAIVDTDLKNLLLIQMMKILKRK
jgi:hypothetical protein